MPRLTCWAIGAMMIGTVYLSAPISLSPDLGVYLAAPFPDRPSPGEYLVAGWGEDFTSPLFDLTISSGFGLRIHPITKDRRPHAGVDYPAPVGTPVLATRGGVVAFQGVAGGYGRLIRLTHGSGFETRYAHLQKWSPGLHVGVTVRAGQIIGYVGESGKATGPHLHYEVRLFGRPLNPDELGAPDGVIGSTSRL